MKVLYDGWSLVYRPNSPAALHTLTLLARLPQEVEALLALPAPSAHPLPARVRQYVEHTGSSSTAQLQWEQRRLPALAKRENVDLVHLTGDFPALFGPAINLTSPSGFDLSRLFNLRAGSPRSLVARLRSALAQGGASRLKGVLWPDDLPDPGIQAPLLRLPPLVHPAFLPNYTPISALSADQIAPRLKNLSSQELPQTFVLYHGPSSEGDLGLLLDAWTWAAGSIGEYYPLLLLGQAAAAKRIQSMVTARGLNGTVQVLPNLDMESLILLYRRCSALFHPAPVSPWGGPGRLALSSQKPVVSLENRFSDALFGPAAYLVPEQMQTAPDARALGAAIITLIVESSLAETLVQAASRRATDWQAPTFERQLYSAYQKLLAGKGLK